MTATDPQADSELTKPSRRRRVWRAIKRLGLAVIALIAVFLLFGFFYERSALRRIAADFPPPGKRVDIGGRSLHLDVQGEGSPTVVFESGLGGSSLAWDLVAPNVARATRVVAYDRAGLGWSDPGPPCDPGTIADDLHAALRAAAIDGPYVLVGHSIGGIYVRMYSYRYASDVAGIVLVDSSHEDQFDRFPEQYTQPLRRMGRLLPVAALSAHCGIPRIFLKFRDSPFALGSAMPEEPRRIARELSPSHVALRAIKHEVNCLWRNGEQLKAEATAWGDMPLAVLTAGTQMPSARSEVAADGARELWSELQRELASRSSNATHRVVWGCGHAIHHERPGIVVDEILRMVDAVRRKDQGATPQRIPHGKVLRISDLSGSGRNAENS